MYFCVDFVFNPKNIENSLEKVQTIRLQNNDLRIVGDVLLKNETVQLFLALCMTSFVSFGI